MAGATNRAMKSAGVPKASIKTIRIKAGGRLTLQSAISIAREHGLDVGKAPEHLARREAKVETKRQAAQASAKAAQQGKVARSLGDAGKGMLAARKAEGERKAALQAASARRQTQVTGSVGAASKAMLAARKAGAKPSFDGAMTKFKAHAQKQIDDYYAANFPNSKTKPTLHYSDGEKYIRVTKVEPGQKTGSAHSFIDKATGDVLKPDGFKRPAKGARGNIFSGDFGVNEHGANYSAAYMKRRGATDFYAAPSKGPSKREKQANADMRDVVMGPRKAAAAAAPSFNKARNADRRASLRAKVQDRAQAIGSKVSVLRSALATAEAGRSKQYATSEPQWSDIRGKNRQEREKKFDRAKREWNRPTRRARKIAALVESGQKKVNRLIASETRLTGAIKRVRGE